ncbi:MAG: hypothetical protein WC473_05425 [Patescibacteria group bacterium]|jgi:hypothetical protein
MQFLLTWVAEGWKNGNKIAVVQKTVIIYAHVLEPGGIQKKIDASYTEEHQKLISVCMPKSRGAECVVIYHQPIVLLPN